MADEKAEATQQGAREPDAEDFGAKDAQPPRRKDEVNIERRHSNGVPGEEVPVIRERTEEGHSQPSVC